MNEIELIKYIDYHLEPEVRAYYGYDIVKSFYDILRNYSFDKVFFVSEDNIFHAHGETFVNELILHQVDCEVLLINGSEKHKTLKNVDKICCEMIRRDISKDSIVIGFGGGCVGNISGLVAGLIYRGISYIEIPTTFMGMTDSSLSNKQGVNGYYGKNQIGRYYAPLFVWTDLKYSETESIRNIRAAITEGVKNVMIQDIDIVDKLFSFIKGKKHFSSLELFDLFEMITQSKNRILFRDPSEKDYCVILEYGHTFGHAIEFMTDGRIIHGEAVAIGMCIAAEISYELDKISLEDVEIHYSVLGDLIFCNNENIKILSKLSVSEICDIIKNDNKRTGEGTKYVVLEKIGECSEMDGMWQIRVDEDVVVKAIEKGIRRIIAISLLAEEI